MSIDRLTDDYTASANVTSGYFGASNVEVRSCQWPLSLLLPSHRACYCVPSGTAYPLRLALAGPSVLQARRRVLRGLRAGEEWALMARVRVRGGSGTLKTTP